MSPSWEGSNGCVAGSRGCAGAPPGVLVQRRGQRPVVHGGLSFRALSSPLSQASGSLRRFLTAGLPSFSPFCPMSGMPFLFSILSSTPRNAALPVTWVAPSAELPTSAQVMISRVMCSSPASGSVLTAQSLELLQILRLPLSLSLCASPIVLCFSVSFSLSKINQH